MRLLKPSFIIWSTLSLVTVVAGTVILLGTSGSVSSEKPSPRTIRRAMRIADADMDGL